MYQLPLADIVRLKSLAAPHLQTRLAAIASTFHASRLPGEAEALSF